MLSDFHPPKVKVLGKLWWVMITQIILTVLFLKRNYKHAIQFTTEVWNDSNDWFWFERRGQCEHKIHHSMAPWFCSSPFLFPLWCLQNPQTGFVVNLSRKEYLSHISKRWFLMSSAEVNKIISIFTDAF